MNLHGLSNSPNRKRTNPFELVMFTGASEVSLGYQMVRSHTSHQKSSRKDKPGDVTRLTTRPDGAGSRFGDLGNEDVLLNKEINRDGACADGNEE